MRRGVEKAVDGGRERVPAMEALLVGVIAVLAILLQRAVTTRRLERLEQAARTLEDELVRTREKLGELESDSREKARLLEYLDCIFDSLTSGLLVVDVSSKIICLNREGAVILRAQRDDLIGRKLYSFPQLQGLFALINDIRSDRPLYSRSSRQYEVEIMELSGGGRNIPLGVSINALLDDDGGVMGYVVIFRDLTERKKLLATIERAEKLSALGTMASGIAHNFNNILAAILGRAQLLLRYPDKTDLEEGLRVIEKSALDGAAMVKRLQDFARNRVTQEGFSPLDVNELVEDVLEFTGPRWRECAAAKGVHYEVETDLKCTAKVMGSGSELREVLINLVINAMDAMPDGGTLTVSTWNDARVVYVSVEDTGIGMSEETRKYIFDPFFTTKGSKGTGLGLSESYGIVKRHRGAIFCESEEGRGTRFVLEFPVAGSGEDLSAERMECAPLEGRLRMLVVDDDPVQCELLEEMLTCEGHEIEAFSSAEEALGCFVPGKFDVVLTDLGMPGMDGWKLCERIREHDPDVALVVFSGMADEFGDEELMKRRVDASLAKPLTLDKLRSVLHSVVRRRGAE